MTGEPKNDLHLKIWKYLVLQKVVFAKTNVRQVEEISKCDNDIHLKEEKIAVLGLSEVAPSSSLTCMTGSKRVPGVKVF